MYLQKTRGQICLFVKSPHKIIYSLKEHFRGDINKKHVHVRTLCLIPSWTHEGPVGCSIFLLAITMENITQ
jgi:hypothetical protein